MPHARPLGRTAVFALVGDVTGSSRALRQLRELSAMGVETEVLQTAPPRDPDAVPGVAVTVLDVAGTGPAAFWSAHRAIAAAGRARPAGLYLASDLYVLPALAAAAERWGGALVYDSRELYAALDSSAGRPWVSAVWRAVERRFIGRADAVLTVSDGIADRLAETTGVARPTVLFNAPEPNRQRDRGELARALELPDDGRVVVLYQGLFRSGRGLETLIGAAKAVGGVRLVLIGEGALEGGLRTLGKDLGDRLVVHPFVPPDRLAALTPGADLGACLIEPLTESLRLSLPNKLFEYLSADVPVLASPLPEIRAVLSQGVGVLADPSSPAAVADALRQSLDPGLRAEWSARAAGVLDRYSWDRGRLAFRALTDRLLP